MFLTESWFWRGTQSAVFYYVSCSPWVEHQHKRKRRKEAEQAEKDRAEIVMTQPGAIVQPGPFQTNPDWAEEIIRGPGPPKGWKKDKMLQGFSEHQREQYRNAGPTDELAPATSSSTESDRHHNNQRSIKEPPSAKVGKHNRAAPSTEPFPMMDGEFVVVDDTVTRSSSSTEPSEHPRRTRPSMDRRLSTAVDNIKDTIKGWNWKRYDREDEILSGLNERLSRMWDRATHPSMQTGVDGKKPSLILGRKRAGTTGTTASEGYDYQRAVRNPEINELHPPVVSQLPATRDDAAWMLLPPPSAAVMAGRSRPQDEPALRWPLARIGRDGDEWAEINSTKGHARSRAFSKDSHLSRPERTPDLSNSSSDESWSDEDVDDHEHDEQAKRHSAPVHGWTPVIPKPTAHTMRAPSTGWSDSYVW